MPHHRRKQNPYLAHEINMDFLSEASKINEAYCVRKKIPIDRRFSDAEWLPYIWQLGTAEREIYGEWTPERVDAEFRRILKGKET